MLVSFVHRLETREFGAAGADVHPAPALIRVFHPPPPRFERPPPRTRRWRWRDQRLFAPQPPVAPACLQPQTIGPSVATAFPHPLLPVYRDPPAEIAQPAAQRPDHAGPRLPIEAAVGQRPQRRDEDGERGQLRRPLLRLPASDELGREADLRRRLAAAAASAAAAHD